MCSDAPPSAGSTLSPLAAHTSKWKAGRPSAVRSRPNTSQTTASSKGVNPAVHERDDIAQNIGSICP